MSVARYVVFLLAALTVGCTSDVEPLTPAQRQAVAAYVSKVAPSPQHRLDLDFDGKVRLLGYDVDREQWRPGQTMRVTWYWQVVKALGKGSKLFTHIGNPENDRTLTQDGNGTLRWLYGPDRWRSGEYIRDAQELHLPEDWAGDSALIFVGLSHDGERLRVLDGGSDRKGRAMVATIPTPTEKDDQRPKDSVPKLAIVKSKRPPRLDGVLSDPVWRFANTTRAFVETRNGGVAPIQTSAMLLWDERYLYVGVDVKDPLLRASHTTRDDHLWEQDCVELMIDPDGDGKNYFEIQVSPRGVIFDTRYDARRVPPPFGHVEWDSKARIGVSARGNLDDEQADAGYSIEIAIPWQAFSLDGKPFAPPAIGDEWRANVYVMDLSRDRQQAAAWSPPLVPDFHVPPRFGILAFEGTPKDMVGTDEPLKISEERMPASLQRRRGLDRDLKDAMMRKRAINRRQPDEPAPLHKHEGAQTLESPEAPH